MLFQATRANEKIKTAEAIHHSLEAMTKSVAVFMH